MPIPDPDSWVKRTTEHHYLADRVAKLEHENRLLLSRVKNLEFQLKDYRDIK